MVYERPLIPFTYIVRLCTLHKIVYCRSLEKAKQTAITMTFHCNPKNRRKQILNMLVFLSGFGFLCLQLWHTFQTFIEQRSTFDVSKQLHQKQKPPTIIFCSIHEWDNNVIWSGTNFSDKGPNHFLLKQQITLFIYLRLP